MEEDREVCDCEEDKEFGGKEAMTFDKTVSASVENCRASISGCLSFK